MYDGYRLVHTATEDLQTFTVVGVVRWIDLHCDRFGTSHGSSLKGVRARARARYTLSLESPKDDTQKQAFATATSNLLELQQTSSEPSSPSARGVVANQLGPPVLKFEKDVFNEYFGEERLWVWDERGFDVSQEQANDILEGSLVKVTFRLEKKIGVRRDVVTGELVRVDVLKRALGGGILP
ncbi:hypothetical protein BDN72DRAFT_862272 [Pluteus cervinus]|uniref:Uncharacterized protein n=1 Tax=Pluteus cervinus TaxID=181527 RepID=A0ACD3AC38_9AGAR|nr:hypothetical protein BDN72DRAFT_862272 [Pluteus cervinus]